MAGGPLLFVLNKLKIHGKEKLVTNMDTEISGVIKERSELI